MRPVDVVTAFWSAMQANDFRRAAAMLTPDCVVAWPCTGEQFVGPDEFAAVQEEYPSTTGRWGFTVHRIVGDAHCAVSEVTVLDGDPAARVLSFFDVADDAVTALTEYWPTAYDPPAHRPAIVRPGPRVP